MNKYTAGQSVYVLVNGRWLVGKITKVNKTSVRAIDPNGWWTGEKSFRLSQVSPMAAVELA